MKKFTLIALCFFVAVFAQAQTGQKEAKVEKHDHESGTVVAGAEKKPVDIKDVIEFKNAEYDFGSIPYGKSAEYVLEMKNISKDSVKLENVQVSCGCTTPKWEQGVTYAPGQSIKVTLGFNGFTKGDFQKFVTLTFSGGLTKQISFKGKTFEVPETPAPANGTIQKMKPAGSK